jgi:hypothetical protein
MENQGQTTFFPGDIPGINKKRGLSLFFGIVA